MPAPTCTIENPAPPRYRNPRADFTIGPDDDWDDIGADFREYALGLTRVEEGDEIRVDIHDAKRWPQQDRVETELGVVSFYAVRENRWDDPLFVNGRCCIRYAVEVR